MIVSKSTHECPRVTTNDHEWPRVTTNDHEWPRLTTSDNEWPRVRMHQKISLLSWWRHHYIILSNNHYFKANWPFLETLIPGFDISAISDWISLCKRSSKIHFWYSCLTSVCHSWILKPVYPIPALEENIHRFHQTKMFSTFNIRDAFQTIKLTDESSGLTTMLTPWVVTAGPDSPLASARPLRSFSAVFMMFYAASRGLSISLMVLL